MATQIVRARYDSGSFVENLVDGYSDGIFFTNSGGYIFVDSASSTGIGSGLGIKIDPSNSRCGVRYEDTAFKTLDLELGFWGSWFDVTSKTYMLSTKEYVSIGNNVGVEVWMENGKITVQTYANNTYGSEYQLNYTFAINTAYHVSISIVGSLITLYIKNVEVATRTILADKYRIPNVGYLFVGNHYNTSIGGFTANVNFHMNFIDSIYFYSGGEATVAERESEIYQMVYADAFFKTTTTILASPPKDQSTEISTKTTIEHKFDALPTAGVHTFTEISADGGRDLSYFYRVEEGSPLSDGKIHINFTNSVFIKTINPVFVGGIVENFDINALYLVNGTLSIDGSGNYSGTGKCIAMKDGELASDSVTVL